MSFKILHLSDLHFSPGLTSNSYAIEQLESLAEIYHSWNIQDAIDRVIVTGDLTEDYHEDSFIRARQYLMKDMVLKKAKSIGLGINDDIKLKIIPGNKDFDFSKIYGYKTPQVYFEGLNTYNEVFPNNHVFFKKHPIIYDWVEFDDEGNGLFIVYINSSFLGDENNQINLKKKFVDFTCEKISELVNNGYAGRLKKNIRTDDRIDSDAYRKSFKILVSHHSLQSDKINTKEFLPDKVKKMFLANLGILDFQVMLSGHGHVHEEPENAYYKIFYDDRAKNRYAVNELKNLVGIKDSPIRILKSNDGRKFSDHLSFIVRVLYSLVDEDENNHDQSIVSEINRIIEGDTYALIDDIKTLINLGKKRKNIDKSELNDVLKYLSNLTDEDRKRLELNSNNIFSKVLKFVKQKTIINFNPGSVSIPYKSGEDRYFNIYEIDRNFSSITFMNHFFKWSEDESKFERIDTNIYMYESSDRTRKKK